MQIWFMQELAEPSKKLVEQTSAIRQQAEKEEEAVDDEQKTEDETSKLVSLEEESNKALVQLDRLLEDSSPVEECPPSHV